MVMFEEDQSNSQEPRWLEGWKVTIGDELPACPGELLHAPVVAITPFDKAGTEKCLLFLRERLKAIDQQAILDWHWVKGVGVIKTLTVIPLETVRGFFREESRRVMLEIIVEDSTLSRRASVVSSNSVEFFD